MHSKDGAITDGRDIILQNHRTNVTVMLQSELEVQEDGHLPNTTSLSTNNVTISLESKTYKLHTGP